MRNLEKSSESWILIKAKPSLSFCKPRIQQRKIFAFLLWICYLFLFNFLLTTLTRPHLTSTKMENEYEDIENVIFISFRLQRETKAKLVKN